MRLKRHSRLYVRILSYFLVLSLLIGLVAGVNYFSFVQQQKRDFQRQMRGNMRAVHSDYSQFIYNVCGLHQMFFRSPEVMRGYLPSGDPRSGDRLAAWEMVQKLRNSMTVLGEGIAMELFTYNDEQRVYSSQGTSDSRHFFSELYCFEDYGYDQWMELLNARAGMKILPTTQVNLQQSVSKYAIPVVNLSYNNGRLCVFVALCSADALAQKYEQTAVFNESEYLVFNQAGELIYDPSGLGAKMSQKLPRDFSVCRIEGRRYDALWEEYGPFGWRVLCITPSSTLLRMGELYIVIAAALCIGVLLLSVVLSYVFSRSIYRPIFGLRQDVENALGEAFSASGNELSDLSRNFRAAMESSSNMRAVQHIHAQQYDKARVLEIIEGRFIADEQILLETLREEFGFEHRYMGCALYEDDRKIGEIPSDIRTMWIAHRSGIVICVYNQSGPEMNEALAEYGQRAGVGDPCDGVHGLCTSFEMAANRYVNRPVEQAECAFKPSAFAPLLRRREVEAALEMVDELSAQLEAVWPGYFSAKAWVDRVYDTCVQTLGMELYRYCDALRTEAYNAMEVLLSGRRINAGPLKNFVRMTVELIPKNVIAHGNYDLAQRIRGYIDAHYFEELSLTILADQMGVSDKYVSRVFKDEFQLNVSDYIALVRVEHAKRLMRGGISISAAARQVGIESRATFIRVFKKLEGMTPSEFVNQGD